MRKNHDIQSDQTSTDVFLTSAAVFLTFAEKHIRFGDTPEAAGHKMETVHNSGPIVPACS